MGRLVWGCLTMAAVTVSSTTANALPALGSPAPPVALAPVDGPLLPLTSARGRPALIVYESREAKAQNDGFKKKLKALAESNDAYRARVALFPVANLEGLAFWPVKGFVEQAVRGESRKIGWAIYCDWDGDLRRKLGLTRDLSTVILLDRSGTVIFAQQGPLSEPEQSQLIALLQKELAT